MTRLSEIKRRVERATKGEWKVEPMGSQISILSRELVVALIRKTTAWKNETERELRIKQSTADAELIAHAPADLQYLMERLERAEAELGQIMETLEAMAALNLKPRP